MLATTRVLSDKQLEAFKRDGFVIVKGLYTPEQVAEIRDTFAQASELGPVEGLWEPKKDTGDALDRFPRMMHPHKQSQLPIGPLSMRTALDPQVGAILNELIGEEALLAQTMFYFKPAGTRGQSLHQDNYYLRVKPGTCVAAWLAVDKCDRENGALTVVPGTQDLEIACPQKADLTIFWSSDHVQPPPGSTEFLCEMEAGDMLFFNGSIIHGSYPNISKDRFRRCFISHYVPACSVEVSEWYRPLHRFDGSKVEMAGATGGGPCGGAEAKGPH